MNNSSAVNMRTVLVILVLAGAVVIAGCMAASPDIVLPKIRLMKETSPDVQDCFFRVNDSAHSTNTGSFSEIRVTGYVSNTCTEPMDNLAVRGTFYDTNGREIASADTPVGYLGYNDVAAFSLSADTQYQEAFTYRLQPVILEPGKLF
ncbi:FxLYD domain-containing protein [uncultured Methanoregula sp.]|uniref:FxLYD domain-containing protein n=1 Tax=uncultured Methanoregula sp. TaxID=1005933 RepID=UPI002AAAC0CB|nr:FxLYD domain-containing protein [uncultured Methanoregula sp.]